MKFSEIEINQYMKVIDSLEKRISEYTNQLAACQKMIDHLSQENQDLKEALIGHKAFGSANCQDKLSNL